MGIGHLYLIGRHHYDRINSSACSAADPRLKTDLRGFGPPPTASIPDPPLRLAYIATPHQQEPAQPSHPWKYATGSQDLGMPSAKVPRCQAPSAKLPSSALNLHRVR